MRSLSPTDAAPRADRSASWRTVRRTAPYLWPRDQPWVRRRVAVAVGLLVVAKIITVLTPVLFGWAADTLTDPGRVPGGALALGALGLTLAYGLSRILTIAFQQLRDVVFSRVGQRALRMIALETFRHIHALSLRYHITRKTGGLSRVIERGVKGVDYVLRILLFSLGPLVLELLLTAGMLWFLFDAWYLAVVAVTVAAYVVYTFVVTEWRVRIRREMNDQDTRANQRAVDSLLNYETVKYFGAEDREARRYDEAMAAYAEAAVRTNNSLAALNFGQGLLINLGLIAVMLMAARGVQAGALTVGEFVMVNTYMIQITSPLNFLGSMYRDIRQALVDMDDMFDLLEQPAEVRDRPGAEPLEVTGGEIVFDRVEFGYDPERPILKGLSFRVAPGQTVAIVGSTGAGKSTIGRLIFRFYDVTGGAIRIDGQDLRDVAQESLHARIGVVPQDTVLFNDTIGYNIGYGRDGATQAEIEGAARAARIHDFIASLPQGYDTQVGERGLKLSGGEKQRVGIARTLLKDPPILLLDEATSALDTATEASIQEELRAMGRGRSVIVIAHRLSTVADADRIVVLEDGRLVEEGSHDALLARGGRYAELWSRQSLDEELAA
ncbi:ABCB family ABC transporter ATP-binding protein/permease [Rubellimicrobium aerolatum]|uniref:ABCB family ABC transporter ATP-binding protein/permease n=1 Tax=Rubellimicrobium aerolatum TaxID=490979 RepID=A0ABW0SBE1_9RHOB|nr:ABC transporter ATP-binding protein/permease [Rubellimicrobium aerolatum]MBP1805557.1 ATP-binding cassette subfamily B protein [Rubellimicrobium aerolatum]